MLKKLKNLFKKCPRRKQQKFVFRPRKKNSETSELEIFIPQRVLNMPSKVTPEFNKKESAECNFDHWGGGTLLIRSVVSRCL